MSGWILIETNFSNKCVECRTQIDVGDSAYWKKGTGLKHYPECVTVTEDKSEIRIIEGDFEDYLK